MQNKVLTIHTDGGSRGNPGPAACGFVADVDGEFVGEGSLFLGNNTNNFAEYQGVIIALEWLMTKQEKYVDVLFLLDSELVVKQINGIYKIKKPELQILNTKIHELIKVIGSKFVFKNIPRELNKKADFLVNRELDNQ